MSQKPPQKIILWLFVIFSVLTSFALIFYGIGVVSNRAASQWLTTFAYVTIAYGMANVTVLSLAWTTREPWSLVVSKLISFCYLGVFIMDAFKFGIKSGQHVAGILVMALVLLTNYLAIKNVIARV